MFECYEFEACEYNAQPKCCLPDGMVCPHGVEGYELTDIEKLIERLRTESLYKDKATLEIMDLCMEVATALFTLRAKNAQLWAELEQVRQALAMMWFAYVNSDKDFPHSYETEALAEAERLLGPWGECMPKYLKRGQKEEER